MNTKKIVFIFDWDDTLFPTSWINNINNNKYNILNNKKFIILDKILYLLISKCMIYGEVIIVTNATINS